MGKKSISDLFEDFFNKYNISEFYKEDMYYVIHFYDPKISKCPIKHASRKSLDELLTRITTGKIDFNKIHKI